MGRYMRKCRRIAEATVMEVTQVVGVKTRARTLALAAAATVPEDSSIGGVSPKRRKETEEEAGVARSGSEELEMAYLQLRNRRLVMTQRLSKSARNSDVKRPGSVERGRISRCSSIASCDAVEGAHLRCTLAGGEKSRGDLGSSVCHFECDRNRNEIIPSSNQVTYSGEIESTEERESLRQSTPQLTMPFAAEIEEFFTAAEKLEKQLFADRYNFDFDNEVPLEGRYDWVRVNQ
ncbi:cyclin-dependent kinase inhibitor 1-like [Phalaenopsis equestris]|uniref:cyclin-dependent kinase inhibitor 1-like n=1 Tax=Phalaenopsis equestris TaxID=78828 RepID=UPI0009E496D4|nr:cyclin-dependent kinase inhibitor 1-like [Phalaenopsis equestris]